MTNPAAPPAGLADGPLTGLRVLDLSRVLAGPWATQILGDLGAEVIKVEQPGRGDDTRQWGPPYHVDAHGEPVEELSAYYLGCNRNKRSIAVDIARPDGADIVRRLAATSDVLVENFRVGGLARYGLGYDDLAAINPRLIYCSVTGFGQDGPYAARGGYDFLIQGMSGLMSVTGQPEGHAGHEPMKTGVPVADLFTGLYATVSILAALQGRAASGHGQHIDCSLLESQMAVLGNQAMNWLVGGRIPRMMGNLHPNVVPYRTFATRDGHVIVAVGNDGQFRSLCRILGLAEAGSAPRFASNSDRLANRDELEALLGDVIAAWSSQRLVDALTNAAVPAGMINRIDQIFADPHVEARGVVRTLAMADGGEVPFVGYPARLGRTPATYRTPPPRLGEHTGNVLRDLLGLGEAELAALQAGEAIALPEAEPRSGEERP